MTQSTLAQGSIWPINQEMVFVFSEPVDFSSVSANTISIRSTANVPATGVFSLLDPFTVAFQPTCPRREDLQDAGLQPSQAYLLRMPGRDTATNVLRSVNGVPLGIQQQRSFATPASTQPSVVFSDVRVGPPEPIVRAHDSTETDATHLELGGDSTRRVYFEHDEQGVLVLDPELGDPDEDAEFLAEGAPLNLYSDQSSRVAVNVAFDQPVNPSASNISATRLYLEFRDNTGTWQRIATRVTLEANCTETGARLRLEPIGVLPPSSTFRAVVEAGFQDIVGQASLQAEVAFAVAPTRPVEFTSLSSDLLSDEFQESYDFGGDSPRSFQDEEALFDSPQAEWGDGRLSAAFSFEGTGGPNGNFDWIVRTGETAFFDTVRQPITGGPDGVPTAVQNTVNGVLDVRHLIIEPGGEIRVQGPNPMRVNATGEVRIDGRLDLSGFGAKDVATLNTGNQVEKGGSGAGGGGNGGDANQNIAGQTPRGMNGEGPFGQLGLGGQGGELGWFPAADPKDSRRPGGGGGGRFSKDWVNVTTIADLSTAAGPGNDGNPASIGATTRASPARGGAPGVGPFIDASDDNDFFGVRPVVVNGQLTELVRGELPSLWAGYGGGGGGNASQIYPNPNWGFGSDEKGGGGGGGAGGLHIKALGRIVFGPQGQIVANGARGGTGENANLLEHIGGTGASGSGGHVILESTAQVDFTAGGTTTGDPLRDYVLACAPKLRAGALGDVNACCKTNSNGGAGGGGVIQIHVQNSTAAPSTDPEADIVVPSAALALPLITDGVTSPPAYVMVPSFGKQSKARSDWISIGGADQNPEPGAPESLVRFLFDGIETSGPDEGKIRRNGLFVADLTPLVEALELATADGILVVDGFTVELTGSALDAIRSGSTSGISNDIYLRTPALLEDCAVRLFVAHLPSDKQDYAIVSASYDEGATPLGDEVLRLQVTTEHGPLGAFNTNPTRGVTAFRLMPRFFQVTTGLVEDALPASAFVRLRFQAARSNSVGAPDEANPLTDPPWTSNLALFNQIPAGELQFFRYEVEFDLDALDEGITADTEVVGLEFLKIPFVF